MSVRTIYEQPCFECSAPSLHINEGGEAWYAYRDHGDVSVLVLYCNKVHCGRYIRRCCDLDIVVGSHCPECGKRVWSSQPSEG